MVFGEITATDTRILVCASVAKYLRALLCGPKLRTKKTQRFWMVFGEIIATDTRIIVRASVAKNLRVFFVVREFGPILGLCGRPTCSSCYKKRKGTRTDGYLFLLFADR